MELRGSLPHSQEPTTCQYPNQINPFLCPSLLTGAACFLPSRAKDLPAPRYNLLKFVKVLTANR